MTLSERIENTVAALSCSFRAFLCALLTVIIWALLGPHFAYSDAWQLVINTGTTIVTFLMAFLIGANQQRSMTLTERHVTAIEDHTDTWEKHAEETHALLTQVHRLTVEVHALATELHTEHRSFRERVSSALGWDT